MSSQEKAKCCSGQCDCAIHANNIRTRITPTFIHEDIFIQNQNNLSKSDCKFTPTFQSTAFEDGSWPCKRSIQHRPPDHQTGFFYHQSWVNAPQKNIAKSNNSENIGKIRPQSAQKQQQAKQIQKRQQNAIYRNDSAFKKQVFLNPHTHCCINCPELGFYKMRNTQSKSQWLDNCKEQRWRNIHHCTEHNISKQRKLVQLSSQPLWGNDSEVCIKAFEHNGILNENDCGCPHIQELRKKEKLGCPFHQTEQSPQKNKSSQKDQLAQTQILIKQKPLPQKPAENQKIQKQQKIEGKIVTRNLNKQENSQKRSSTAGKKIITGKNKTNKKQIKSILYGNSNPLFTIVNKRR